MSEFEPGERTRYQPPRNSVSGARTGLRSVDAAHRGPSLLLVFAFRLLQLVMQVEQPQSSHNEKTPNTTKKTSTKTANTTIEMSGQASARTPSAVSAMPSTNVTARGLTMGSERKIDVVDAPTDQAHPDEDG